MAELFCDPSEAVRDATIKVCKRILLPPSERKISPELEFQHIIERDGKYLVEVEIPSLLNFLNELDINITRENLIRILWDIPELRVRLEDDKLICVEWFDKL